MAKNDGLSRAPVLEVDLCSILGRNRVHLLFSFLVLVFYLRRRRIRRRGFNGQHRHGKSGGSHKPGGVAQKSPTRDIKIRMILAPELESPVVARCKLNRFHNLHN